MREKKAEKKQNLRKFLAPAIIGAFFCFLCFYYGVGQYPDSVTYMENYMDREPLYPLLLKGFRAVFGGSFYLKAVIIAQNLFAFLVNWYLYAYVTRRFRLNRLFRIAVLLVLLFPHLLSGILSASGIILTNAILSEGITLSLYQLFFVCLLKMLLEERKIKYGIYALLAALAAAFARGQMMPMLLVWLVVGIFTVCKCKKYTGSALWGRILGILIITVCSFVIRSVGIQSYNLAVYGIYHGNTGGSLTILTNVLYSADPEAVQSGREAFDEEHGELLEQIYGLMQERGMTSADAGTGFQDRILHHEDNHDKIKFDILYEALQTQVKLDLPEADALDIRIGMDELAGRYLKAVLPHSIGSFLKTYIYVACGGFIRTVAVLHPVMNWLALLIYIVTIGLMCYLFREDKNQDASWMMAMVLLMIAANVCATSMTIMCLSRYMIYNMSIFYVAGIILLQEWYRNREERKHGISESGI